MIEVRKNGAATLDKKQIFGDYEDSLGSTFQTFIDWMPSILVSSVIIAFVFGFLRLLMISLPVHPTY